MVSKLINRVREPWTLRSESTGRIRSKVVDFTLEYGEYGIVGFYAVKDNTLVHFLFSCRTLGMGIEQYTYEKIGCPKLSRMLDV